MRRRVARARVEARMAQSSLSHAAMSASPLRGTLCSARPCARRGRCRRLRRRAQPARPRPPAGQVTRTAGLAQEQRRCLHQTATAGRARKPTCAPACPRPACIAASPRARGGSRAGRSSGWPREGTAPARAPLRWRRPPWRRRAAPRPRQETRGAEASRRNPEDDAKKYTCLRGIAFLHERAHHHVFASAAASSSLGLPPYSACVSP